MTRPESHSDTMTTSARLDLNVTALAQAFKEPSLASPRNTRLLISFPSWADVESPATVPFPRGIGAWGLIGVTQRIQDVQFAMAFSLEAPGSKDPHSTFNELRLDIFYDPAKDSCVLRNRTDKGVRLSCSGTKSATVEPKQHRVVSPGLWRLLLVSEGAAAEQHVLDMLILRRQFTVCISEIDASPSVSGKRKAYEDLEIDSKRSKRVRDGTEIFLIPNTKPPPNLFEPAALRAHTVMGADNVCSPVGDILPMHLEDGDTVTVQAAQASSN